MPHRDRKAPLKVGLVFAALSAFLLSALQARADVDTFAVRTRTTTENASPKTPDELLGSTDVGERFCQSLHCVVFASTPARVSALKTLEVRGIVELEPIPDAHRVFFRRTTYDAATVSFTNDFPGRDEIYPASEVGQFVVVFKSYPESAWIRAIEATGLVSLEPLQTMAYYFYGPRAAANALAKAFPYVYAVLEVPAGIKRESIDWRADGDDDGPALTHVLVVSSAREVVLRALTSIDARPPILQYRTGPTESYSAYVSRLDALVLSALPEVLSVNRSPQPPQPSDERATRIIAGTFRTPGSSWPATLPSNTTSPRYWDGYLSQLSGIGLNLNNQVIGFLDTGIDSGLRRNGSSYCPPFLRPPTYPTAPCKLVFTTDVTSDTAETIANDYYYHGSFTSDIAAGYASTASPGRDGNGYSFTQGVAQGARVAMCQFFGLCATPFRSEGEAAPFTGDNYMQRLRYALVELGSTISLPDSGTGPGASILNHSWNRPSIDYDDSSQLLDQTTRSLSAAWFLFDDGQTIFGPNSPVLHVVSAGNRGPDPANPAHYLVTAPAVAKNVITVGATENYNDQTYTPGCGNNDPGNADNPYQIANLSRLGFSNQRLKPDLVAPGTRSYGWRSVDWNSGCANTNTCNMDLDGTARYGWAAGTSFSAPAVSGAAAIVRDWFRVLGVTSPAPALVKAALIAAARTVTSQPACSSGCSPCCSYCGDVRPAPDKYQGWGGASLDRLLRPASNYYYDNQSTTFTNTSQSYARYLTIADNTKDINISLVWTDRASGITGNAVVNLINDLDLNATILTNSWYGNNYYTSLDSCSRNGYSLKDPSPIVRDRKNNVERITIKASDIPIGATNILIQVNPFSLTGDGIDPSPNNTVFRQDFALFVENARQ